MDKPLTPTDLTRSRMNEADDKQEYVTFKLTTKLADELESIAYKRLLRLRRDRRSQGSQSWRDDLGTATEQLHKAITAAIIEQVDGRRDVVGYERPG